MGSFLLGTGCLVRIGLGLEFRIVLYSFCIVLRCLFCNFLFAGSPFGIVFLAFHVLKSC